MRIAVMWCVVNGIIGGIILCAVGNAIGLGQVSHENYNGALPRYEVIGTMDNCDIVRSIDEKGVATNSIVCQK